MVGILEVISKQSAGVVNAAFPFCVFGPSNKMALLHAWLPKAYCHALTPHPAY